MSGSLPDEPGTGNARLLRKPIMPQKHRPLLLYVENEFLTQCLVEAALRDGGFDVHVASDGHQAMQALVTIGADLEGLLTDIDLGECPDGWQVARAARRIVPTLPVVYVSGASANDWYRMGVSSSVIVEKPFTPSQIVRAMAQLCVTAAR